MVPFLGLARTGWFVQLPIIGGLNEPPRLRPLRRLRRFFLMGAATPPLPRSIQSCPAGQRQNTQETAPSKTKDLSAQFLERGICPHQIIANWTLNSKVVHYRFLYLFVPVPFGASIDTKKFRSAEGKLRPLLAAGGLVCRFLDRSRLSSFFSGCVSHSPHNGCTILHRGFRGLRTANQTSRRRRRRLRMASRTCRASGW